LPFQKNDDEVRENKERRLGFALDPGLDLPGSEFQDLKNSSAGNQEKKNVFSFSLELFVGLQCFAKAAGSGARLGIDTPGGRALRLKPVCLLPGGFLPVNRVAAVRVLGSD